MSEKDHIQASRTTLFATDAGSFAFTDKVSVGKLEGVLIATMLETLAEVPLNGAKELPELPEPVG